MQINARYSLVSPHPFSTSAKRKTYVSQDDLSKGGEYRPKFISYNA